MSLLDATTPERARPVMEYVRRLENLVRHYRSLDRGIRTASFCVGLGAGIAITLLVFLAFHWR